MIAERSSNGNESCTETCMWPEYKGNKWCEDENNNCGCDWDGGDCCGGDTDIQSYSYAYTYCTECLCLDPNYTAPTGPDDEGCYELSWKTDGYCDDENNNSGCEWDGGDCCGTDVDKTWCTVCACLDADSGYMHKR